MKGFKPTTTGIPVNETRHTFIGTGITNADVGKAATLVTGGADVTVALAGADEPVGERGAPRRGHDHPDAAGVHAGQPGCV